ISKVKSDIETSSLTYQQKIAAKAQLEVWTKELNLKDLDAPNNALKDKANENKQAAQDKFDKADKAYQDGPDKGALPDYTKNKDAITNFSAKVAKAKAAVASATVALRDAEVKAAKANLDKDPDNEELKETWEKAKAQLEKAKAEEKSAGAMAKAAELDATVLKKVGDTNVYKSEDGKYTVDLGNEKVAEGKTLVVGKTDNKLYEIDANSADKGAPKHTDKPLLKSNDKGGTIYKGGVEQFSFISKDGNAVAALKGTEGFILKPGVKADYDTMSKATFDAGKFEANGAEQQTYKIETVKTPSPHNPDNPQYKITKVKDLGGAGKDYVFEDRPILDGALDFQVKDMGVVKVPVINGKIYAGSINGYDIDTDANNNIKSITKTGEKEAYNFDADGKVESITKGDFTYTLKEDGHKTLAEAVGLATGAPDALNKASSSVVYNIVGHSYKLKDGKVEKIDLKNGTELTVKAPADFDPNIANLRLMQISKMKFADTPAEFTLTDNPIYGEAQEYEKVAGKFLLKHGNQYKNSVYEDGTHKFTVTDAGENKYTLTETKDGKTVSEEKLENGILKTVKYEADGTTVKSVDIVDKAGGDNDTVTVDTEATSVANTKNVNVANVNNGKVNLAGIEKVEIKPGAELNAKGLDTLNKNQDIKEITLGGDLTLKSANGGNIDLGKVKDGGHNLNVDVTNNAKSDTIKFGTEIAGDKLNINGFKKDDGDKVDFSALGATDKKVNKVESNAEKGLENGKIYTTDVAGDIAAKNYGGADFGELFGDGKAFKTAAAAEGKSIVAVKGNDVTKVYQVNDADKNGTIDNTEVKLVGTFNSSVALEDTNIA
ncbi:hypothetical protein, partial [Campylobacter rectus]|uniref:hypothetical protein n=1 Tax=Campylobacter rectus TaxID=203 RepID=UPI0023F23139